MRRKSITPLELRRWLDEGGQLVVLDVRKKVDFDADPYMIPEAKWMDPEQVAQWASGLGRDAPTVVYCVHGHAVSNGVVDYLRGDGFDASLIEGGIEAWKEAGGPIEKSE